MSEVRRVLRRAGIASTDLDDAAQEVLARAYRRFGRSAGASAAELLRDMARRVAQEYHGRGSNWDGETIVGSSEHVPWLAELAAEARTEIDIDARHALDQVIGALNVLPRLERSLYFAAHWEGKSRTELARQFALRPGTVATRLARADQLLRGALHKLERQDGAIRLRSGALPAWAAPGRRQPGVNIVSRREGYAAHRGWMLVNNQWARARVQEPFDQCLLLRRGKSAGWSWSWPRGSMLPVAFPQAIYGRSPWRPWVATDARFPLRLDRLHGAVLDFAVETQALGSYALLLVMYLVDADVTAAELTPANIVTELTLVLDYRGHAAPLGAIYDRLLVDGVRYDLRRLYGAGAPELLGYLGFYLQPSVPRRAGRLNLANLLGELVRRRHVDVPLALASIEMGNEVNAGAGTTWIERLELTLETT